jgi:hypothetical protein
MDDRQTHRLAELVAASEMAISSAAAEPTEPAAQRPQPAFETSYRVIERERFLPWDVAEMASTVRSMLLEARSCQVLAEIEFFRGRPPTPGARARWTAALDEANAAGKELRDAVSKYSRRDALPK